MRFDFPTQVMFIDIDSTVDNFEALNLQEVIYLGGIGYNDEIICGCCGAIFSIDELNKDFNELIDAREDLQWLKKYPAIYGMEWVNISEEILGGENQPPIDEE